MAFVIIDANKNVRKFVVDFRDKPSIKESAYHWCDEYAKINFNLIETDIKFHDKIVYISPGFGIRIWSWYETVFYCIGNYLKCSLRPLVSLRNHMADYYAQFMRPLLSDYANSKTADLKPYVFMIATLWKNTGTREGVNLIRKMFMEEVKATGCRFEGGFYAIPGHPQYDELQHLTFAKRYSTNEYIEKTKRSSVVFNTPAVHNCHGWKLGEYLAMGKAIISTPLLNELPAQMEHGKNIYIISESEDFKSALLKLLSDLEYRNTLEGGAKAYYLKYASPKAVINLMI